jgi:aminoglycoside phosphotransferase (APT) family kinase protein
MTTAILDPAIPFLDRALDPSQALPVLARQLGEHVLHSARLIRHKPGRRALIEYDASTPTGRLTIIGKVRAKGLDVRTHATMVAARRAGVPVPEPLGLVPEFQMLLQCKEPGIPLTELLDGPRGEHLAEAAAELVHQLHRAAVPAERVHTLADEVRILHERLAIVAEHHPGWEPRLTRILDAVDGLAATIPAPSDRLTGIHRDFYADQVLVDGDRLILLDFDLYCAGDPALDIGNFAAHIIEQSLREHGRPAALVGRERAFVDRYLTLAGVEQRRAVEAYTTLSLVRHIWISTRIAERNRLTETLIELSEQRLGIVHAVTSPDGMRPQAESIPGVVALP